MIKPSIISCVSLLLLAATSTAFGGTKEEILRLQSDVLAMQNQIRMLEKTFKEQTEGLRSLVVQLNDQIGKTNLILTKVSATLDNQSVGDKSGNQAVVQELRNLVSKVDDSNTRLSVLAQQMQDLKVQAKPIESRGFAPGADAGGGASPDSIYNQAYSDLIQGNFDLAIDAFTSFVKNYPAHDKASDAQYGIGEAYYNSNKLPQAIAAFTRVVSDYPTANRAVSAYFKRGKAELGIRERENAIADFKTVIEKYPDSPEGSMARTELDNLGVSYRPPKTSTPAKRKPRE